MDKPDTQLTHAEKAKLLRERAEKLQGELRSTMAHMENLVDAIPAPAVKGKRAVALDFDGVIHAYRKDWHDGTIYDGPMEGAIAGLKRLMDVQPVYVYSCRNPVDIVAWFHEHAAQIHTLVIPEDVTTWDTRGVIGVTNRKLPAAVIVDDRCYRFTTWRDVVNLLG